MQTMGPPPKTMPLLDIENVYPWNSCPVGFLEMLGKIGLVSELYHPNSASMCASARYVIIPPPHPPHPPRAWVQVILTRPSDPIFGRKWPRTVVTSDRVHFGGFVALSANVTFCGRKRPHFVVTSDPNPVFCLWSQVTGFCGRKWPPCR